MKLAVLGGSFNPLHIGHLFLADEVCRRLKCTKVLLIPAHIPPHKSLAAGATAEYRLAMLRAATADNDFFEVDDREIRRGGVSFSYDTVQALQAEYGSVLSSPIALIIGDDLAADFGSWHNAEALSRLADIVVCHRDSADTVPFLYSHQSMNNALLPVSSSDIRSRIAAGKSWRYLVPPAVYEYITRNKLYGYSK